MTASQIVVYRMLDTLVLHTHGLMQEPGSDWIGS